MGSSQTCYAHDVHAFVGAIGSKRLQTVARFDVPKLDRFILAARCQDLTIQAKRDRSNFFAVPLQRQRFSICGLSPVYLLKMPQLNDSIAAAGEQLSIRAKRD